MRPRRVLLGAAIVSMTTAGCLVSHVDDDDGVDDEGAADCGPPTAIVQWVYDGDTIQLEGSEERVRYILVGAPEIEHDMPAECYGDAAKQRNIELVAGQEIELTYDAECRDRYGRLLAYIEVDGVDVNRTLIEEGYACILQVLPNGQDRIEDYEAARAAAESSGLGLWGTCPEVCD